MSPILLRRLMLLLTGVVFLIAVIQFSGKNTDAPEFQQITGNGERITLSTEKNSVQEIRVSLKNLVVGNIFAVGLKGEPVRIDRGCRQIGVLLCIDVTPIKNWEQYRVTSYFSLSNADPFNFVDVFESKNSKSITLRLTGGRLFELLVDDAVLNSYGFNTSIGLWSMRNSGGYEISILRTKAVGDSMTFLYRDGQSRSRLSLILFVFEIIFLVFLIMSEIKITLRSRGKLFLDQAMVFQAMAISGCLTLCTVLVGMAGIYGRSPGYARDGIGYIPSVRFSDLYQVWGIAKANSPFSYSNTDYSPFFLAIFRALDRWTSATDVLFLLIVLAVVVILMLLWTSKKTLTRNSFFLAILVTCASYPLLFSIERGGTDLILLPVVSLALFLIYKKKFFYGAVLLGVAIALKVIFIVFLLIYLRRNKYIYYAFVSLAICILLNVFSALLLPEAGLSELSTMVSHYFQRGTNEGVGLVTATSNNSIFAFFTGVFGVIKISVVHIDKTLNMVTTLIALSLVLSVGVWALARKRSTSSLLLVALVVTLVIFPISGNYRLIFFVPVLWFCGKENFPRSKVNRDALVLLSGVLISAHPLVYIDGTYYAGQLLNLPLLLSILLLTVIDEKAREINISEPALELI